MPIQRPEAPQPLLDIDGCVDPTTPHGQAVIQERRQFLDETRDLYAATAMAAARVEADDVNPEADVKD